MTFDASGVGIGAVFTQKVKGKIQTVAFISRRQNSAELSYSDTKGDPDQLTGGECLIGS